MKKDFITIYTDTMIKRIDPERILFINGDAYCTTIYIENEDTFTSTKSLKEFEELLPDYFVRINRNKIVNTQEISKIMLKQRKIVLFDNSEHQISFRRIKTVKQTFR